MPTISLTDFVDFVSGVGPTKLTKVREIKGRDKYQHRFDFWRELREAIIVFHSEPRNKNEYFKTFLDGLDASKRSSCEPLVGMYKSFLGRKLITSLPIEHHTIWQYKQLKVRINPEMALNINNKPYLVKLYFKSASLTKSRVDVILLLMAHALPKPDGSLTYALLDVHHNRFYDAEPQQRLLPLLHGEADSFLTMWNETQLS